MIEKTVPEIILDQLGGNRFLVMTGCHHLLGDKKSLSMTIPRNGKCYQTKAINEIVQTYDGVYFDQLQALFTHVTGMYTSL